MNPNQLEKTVKTIADQLTGRLPRIEKRMLEQVLLLAKELEVRNGNLVASTNNLRIAQRIQARLKKLILTKEYVKSVADYVNGYLSVYTLANDYYTAFGAVKREALYRQLRTNAVNSALDMLTETGINANVIRPIGELLTRNITSRASYADMTESIREQLTETDKGSGLLSRYAKAYTVTAINQYSGQLNKLMSDELGFEWFMYVGSNKETTREWCLHMTKKKWVHRSEFAELLKGHVDGHACKLSSTTDLPLGMFSTTTEETLQVDCGGWNCGHKFYGVPLEAVPEQVLNDFTAKHPNR